MNLKQRNWTWLRAALALMVVFCGLVSDTRAATYPAGFNQTQIAGGLLKPTTMAIAPDGRIFVCEQEGELRVIKNGQLLATPFVSLDVDFDGERGLVGIVFDPQFASNGWVYLYYTAKTPTAHNRISRFTANGDVALTGSETIILDLPTLGAAKIHNGGSMRFSSDGKMFVAVGENATPANAQSLNSLLGKILRINKDGSIPADNPYYDTLSGDLRAIYALGFRNPFSFDIQPGTGRIFANDVGGSAWEEINEIVPTGNYGWPTFEGPTNDQRFQTPFYAYPHSGTPIEGCAITGGIFYNPQTASFPVQYTGKYFFTDYCSGWIYTIDPQNPQAGPTPFASNLEQFPVDLKTAPDGSLYYIAYGYGAVYRISYTPSAPPQILEVIAPGTTSVGQSATFSSRVSGDAPLSFQWRKNGVDIVGANTLAYTTPPVVIGDNGAQFSLRVSNPFGTVTSSNSTLQVTARQAPTVNITSPLQGSSYQGGQSFTFTANATNNEGAAITDGASFRWKIDFYHDAHSHPALSSRTGREINFTIPTRGETAHTVFFRATLTVTDAQGLNTTVTRDIFPRKSDITLQTNIAGLKVTLDGAPYDAPKTVTGVVGIIREIGVAPQQTVNGITYQFENWSDGGTATHEITTAATNTTYTAQFYALPEGDYTNPTVTLTSPSGWENRYDAPQVLAATGTASDVGSGLRQVRVRLRRLSDGLYWNTEGWQTQMVENIIPAAENWSFTLPSFAGSDPATRYGLLAISQDNAFNQAYAYTEFFVNPPVVVDNQPPLLTIATPANGAAFTAPAQITASGSATDTAPAGATPSIARVIYNLGRKMDVGTNTPTEWWNGNAWVANVTDLPTTLGQTQGNSTSWSATLPTLGAESYLLRAQAFDGANNSGSGSVSVIRFVVNATPPDTQAPEMYLYAPREGFSYPATFTANGGVVDNAQSGSIPASGIAGVTYNLGRNLSNPAAAPNQWWNGSAWTTPATNFNATLGQPQAGGLIPWSASLPTLTDGMYSFEAITRDNAGNSTSVSRAAARFWVDTVAPTSTVVSIRNGYSYRTLSQVSGTASDVGAGVSQVRARLQRQSDRLWWNGNVWGAYAEVPTNGTTNWTFALPSLTDNRYSFSVAARDWRGNTRSSDVVDFYIDTLAPTLTVSTPVPNGTYASITRATGTASDAGPGVFGVRGRLQRVADGLWWNGSTWGAYTETPATGITSWTWTFPTLQNGRYIYTAIARDFYGNTTYSAPVEITKSNTGLTAASRGAATTVVKPDARALPNRPATRMPTPQTGTPQAAPVPNPTAPAISGLSSLYAGAARQVVTLKFTLALNADSATNASNYVVLVNGSRAVVEGVFFNRATNTVTLQLSDGALKRGDRVQAGWNLRGARGNALAGRQIVSAQ